MTTWPKVLPPVDPDEQAVIDDAIKRWHENLPGSYRTIEIGAGLGEQLAYEDLSRQDYTCVEMRAEMASTIEDRYPSVTTLVGDCQQRLPLDDASFDRAIAVHVLEHLPDLPRALDEVHRLLRPGGRLSIVIPCDPGLVYGIGRRFTAQREFEKRYKLPYEIFIKREHINAPAEILELVRERFDVEHRRFFPLRVPIVDLNVCMGVTVTKP